MNAVFADTFYWAALTNIDDPANERALTISRSLAPHGIVATDEVLAEYLTFFARARPSIRDRAGQNVAALLDNLEVRIVLTKDKHLKRKLPSYLLQQRTSRNRGDKTLINILGPQFETHVAEPPAEADVE